MALRPLALARRSAAARVATRVDAVATPVRFAEPDPVVAPRPDSAMPSMEDPWTDPKWRDVKWTVYRDVAYDMQPFVDKHPGGNWLLNLSIQRDCTALIESYHLRPEVSEARFKGLPVLEDFPVNAVPKSPRPNDSELYNAIRTRVRKELFPQEGKAMHRQGGTLRRRPSSARRWRATRRTRRRRGFSPALFSAWRGRGSASPFSTAGTTARCPLRCG